MGRSTAVWFAGAELLSAGVGPPRVPLADACCVVLVLLSRDGSFESHLPRCSRAHDKV
jgi:hypothetical protein